MKKIHWTQTKAGKDKLALRRKHDTLGSSEEAHIIYAFGHTQAWLQVYADSVGLPSPAVAYRVGELLRRSARRPVLGA